MTREELCRFVADQDDPRYELHHPFSVGKWSYATNGHIAVRVPRLADVEVNRAAPNVEKLFAQTEQLEFVPVPVCESPPDVKCMLCDGSGLIQDGDDREDCSDCGATGKVECHDGLAVGNARFQKRYLAMIQNWEIAPNGVTAAWIRNGEASGLLMPLQW